MSSAVPEAGRAEPAETPHGSARGVRRPTQAALTLGALGVVFGDIGTSPIYTIQTLFNPGDPHPVPIAINNVYGLVSLIFWSVTLIVTVKYILFVLRADNHGEGGILSLITLIGRKHTPGQHRTKIFLAGLGVLGAALFFGDSMITPAISVLSAVEGLEVVEPALAPLVVPATAVIIVVLFAVQRFGTAKVGRLFGPVMMVWFVAIGAAGIGGIVRNPEVLAALSPTYALGFLVGQFHIAFFALAGVVLAITGAEALYADLGHFGRPPITRAWLFMVFPALVLSYLGQGALVLENPKVALSTPFFLLVPDWARIPMVLLATAATVIASQAVIAGAFSLTHQAVQLNYLPRLEVRHTSAQSYGQIYVPWINWALLVGVLVLVFAFRSSNALAYAYGMAVTVTITITTISFFYLVRKRWHKPWWMVIGGAAIFLSLEGLFLAANLTKFAHGAYLPLAIGLVFFTVMMTWQRGRRLVTDRREADEGNLQHFIDELPTAYPHLRRVPGTAVFLNRGKRTTPLAMRANVEHNHILHQRVIIVSVLTVGVPYLDDESRLTIDDLGRTDDGIVALEARYGYMEKPDVPRVLQLATDEDLEAPIDADTTSYFLSTIDLQIGDAPGMTRWRKHLFLATSRMTADAAEYFNLPRDRTLIMGSVINL